MKKLSVQSLLLGLFFALPAQSEELRLPHLLSQVAQGHPLAQSAEAEVDVADAMTLSARGAFDLQADAQGSYSPLGKYQKTRGSVGLKQPTTAAGLQLWTRYENGSDFAPYYGGSVTSDGGRLSAGLLLPLLQGRAIDPARLDEDLREVREHYRSIAVIID